MKERPPGGPGVQVTRQRTAKLLEDGHPCPLVVSWQPGGEP